MWSQNRIFTKIILEYDYAKEVLFVRIKPVYNKNIRVFEIAIPFLIKNQPKPNKINVTVLESNDVPANRYIFNRTKYKLS